MKQEPTESPSSTALASRIARYSYEVTPSPNRKRPITPIKNGGPSSSPYFTRTRTSTGARISGTVLSPTTIMRSPHFTQRPPTIDLPEFESGPGAAPELDSEDDLESLEGVAEAGSYTRPDLDGESGEGDESDGLGDLISDDSEDDEEGATTPSRQNQSRIPARRAGRQERHLVQDGGTSTSSGSRGKRPRVKREGNEVERTPKKKKPRGYAGPETYQHLRPLPDLLVPELDVVFCGINPGVRSSTTGHHFGHPTNKFWRSLHQSGMTPRLIKPEEDHLLPREFKYGLTVLVDRPTAEQSELSTHEMRLNVLPFTEKLCRIKPGVVCFVGKKIWDVYESVISKSAREIGTIGEEVKAEIREEVAPSSTPLGIEDVVKGEETTEQDVKPTISQTSTSESVTTPLRQRRIARQPKEKERFDWTKPRAFRLPHKDGEVTTYTYFWVVPNTSGLERTPLAEQTVLFGHLRSFNEEVKAGRVEGIYRDIDIDGVKGTVQTMERAAEARQMKQE